MDEANLQWMKLIGLDGYYVSGYKLAAEKLLELAKTEKYLFFPMAFLYRQSIEIHFKYLLFCMKYLNVLPITDDEMYGHDLEALWKNTRLALVTKWPNGGEEELDAAEAIIMDFHNADPTGQELRYAMFSEREPSDKKKNGKSRVSTSYRTLCHS